MTKEHEPPGSVDFSQNAFFSFLVERGLVGLAWADENFHVQGTRGKLAWWISPGDTMTQDLPPFVGLEDDLRELMDDFRPSLVLANVGMNVGAADSEKTSIEVFWRDATRQFVLVLHRLGGQPEFEADMARQVRGRRLAEETIAAMQRRVAKTQGQLDVIAEHAPLGLAIHDLDDHCSFVTKRWLELMPTYRDTSHADQHGAFSEGMHKARMGHESYASPVNDTLPSDLIDTEFEGLAWHHSPWLDAQSRVCGVVSAVYPVHEMSNELRALRGRVHDLERVNADLESFAALLSHDVRAPLVSLRSKLAGAEPAQISPGDVDATLSRVLQIADGLLDYATGTGLSGPEHAVDVEAMARRIAEDCTGDTAIRYEFEGEWPVVTTAVAPLDIVLRNLIQNAVRHHDRPQGIVRLTGTPGSDVFTIEVADDGPGIPPELHEKIFSPMFKAAAEDTSTTGLGLAFVRRAVSSVGAKLDLESDPGQRRGTVFRLHWPT